MPGIPWRHGEEKGGGFFTRIEHEEQRGVLSGDPRLAKEVEELGPRSREERFSKNLFLLGFLDRPVGEMMPPTTSQSLD